MLIHCLEHTQHSAELNGILQKRATKGSMPLEDKKVVIEYMKATESFQYALDTLSDLEYKIFERIAYLEKDFGRKNYLLRYLVERLKPE